jgi:hypothetical protein
LHILFIGFIFFEKGVVNILCNCQLLPTSNNSTENLPTIQDTSLIRSFFEHADVVAGLEEVYNTWVRWRVDNMEQQPRGEDTSVVMYIRNSIWGAGMIRVPMAVRLDNYSYNKYKHKKKGFFFLPIYSFLF